MTKVQIGPRHRDAPLSDKCLRRFLDHVNYDVSATVLCLHKKHLQLFFFDTQHKLRWKVARKKMGQTREAERLCFASLGFHSSCQKPFSFAGLRCQFSLCLSHCGARPAFLRVLNILEGFSACYDVAVSQLITGFKTTKYIDWLSAACADTVSPVSGWVLISQVKWGGYEACFLYDRSTRFFHRTEIFHHQSPFILNVQYIIHQNIQKIAQNYEVKL